MTEAAPPDLAHAGARLTIDRAALAANWRALAALAPAAETAAVVKADAYGLGLDHAIPALWAAGARTFFVALPQEARRVRALNPDATLYLLGGLFDAAPMLAAHAIRPVLNSLEDIEAWAAQGRAFGRPLPCALHVDTGMNRLGLTLDEATAHASALSARDDLAISLVMTHLACADTPEHPLNRHQAAAAETLKTLFPAAPLSVLNSAGLISRRFDAHALTRPGIALYGGESVAGHPPLAPVVTLEARILQVRDVQAGDTVGYGGAQTLRRDSRIAIIAAGYADGFHRLAGSADARPGARARLAGHDCPLVGRVSMDLIAVDVSACPPEHAQRGGWVTLVGDGIRVDDVARHAGTIGYEVLTSLGPRAFRRVI